MGLRKDIITFLTASSGEFAARDTISEIIGDLTSEDAEHVEEAMGGDVDENDSTILPGPYRFSHYAFTAELAITNKPSLARGRRGR